MKDYVGCKFGRLTVIEDLGRNERSHRIVKVQCSCGTVKIIRASQIDNGGTVSCGCFFKEQSSRVHKTHGYKGTPTYCAWVAIAGPADKGKIRNLKERGYANNRLQRGNRNLRNVPKMWRRTQVGNELHHSVWSRDHS